MALEDRIQTSLDEALAQLRARVEAELRDVGSHLVTIAREECDDAVQLARRALLEETRAEALRQVAEAETRAQATLEQSVAEARADERSKADAELQQAIEAAAADQVREATAAAEVRLQTALAAAAADAGRQMEVRVSEARVREREADLASLTRLLDSVRGLDGASSLSEVLDALGQAISREASRTAVLVVRDERLLGWKVTGFGPRDMQPKTIDLALTEAGVISQAVSAARAVTTRDSQSAAGGPPFAQLPPDRMGFAVPVIVSGRVVAVAYADSVTGDEHNHIVPSAWPEVIEVLVRHAARCLEALTAQKAASAPAPRFTVAPGKSAAPATPQSTKPTSDSPSTPRPDVPPPGVRA